VPSPNSGREDPRPLGKRKASPAVHRSPTLGVGLIADIPFGVELLESDPNSADVSFWKEPRRNEMRLSFRLGNQVNKRLRLCYAVGRQTLTTGWRCPMKKDVSL
jgi:hypothetical protein